MIMSDRNKIFRSFFEYYNIFLYSFFVASPMGSNHTGFFVKHAQNIETQKKRKRVEEKFISHLCDASV